MTRLVQRAWVPLVMVIVVAVAAFTVSRLHGIFGSNMYRPDAGNADAIVQFNPKRVLYEIFGPAGTVADINYLDADAQPQRVDGATLPWSFELVTTLTAVAANVVAQGDSDTIGCRITVNGEVREEHSVDAYKCSDLVPGEVRMSTRRTLPSDVAIRYSDRRIRNLSSARGPSKVAPWRRNLRSVAGWSEPPASTEVRRVDDGVG
jgi:hypothetical protein